MRSVRVGLPSPDHHHCPFQDLIVKLLNVQQVHHDAAPGKMTWAAIVPLSDPAVKTDAPAELRGFECCDSLFPGGLWASLGSILSPSPLALLYHFAYIRNRTYLNRSKSILKAWSL